MTAFRNIPIRRKLTLGIMAASLIPLLLAAALVFGYERGSLRARAVRDMVGRAELLAVSTRPMLEFDDQGRAEETLATLRARPEMLAAALYSPDGRVFASYRRADAGSFAFPKRPEGDSGTPRFVGDDLEFFHPIHSGEDTVGHVYLRLDLTEVYDRLKVEGWIVLGVLAVLVSLAYWLSLELQQVISRPILALAGTAQAVRERKDYSVRAEKHGQDEIGTLTDSFNQMLAVIHARDHALHTANEALHEENIARKRAEDEVHELNDSLEQRVLERTAELAKTVKELEAAVKELEQFSYVSSHDLQEPLRAVAGCVEILKLEYGGRLDSRAAELIRHTVEGTRRMQTLINDLLAYSRVARRGESFRPTDCNAALTLAKANLSTAIRESGAAITQDPLPTLTADPTQLPLLFQNLIANAIKFCAGRRPEIHVGAERWDGGWRFSVRDNGIGIEPQYYDRIFVIFQRLHTRTEYPGTGMGLAICKRIVERHGGEISVESAPGIGSTFHFTIPEKAGPAT